MRIACALALSCAAAWAQSEDLEQLKKDLEDAKRRIEALERARAPHEHGADEESLSHSLGSGVTARLLELSLDVIACGGTSTAHDAELDVLNPGHHDPSGRGFTLQNAEISARGGVDPYFEAAAHVTWVISDEGETEVELEEAFFQTTSLPGGLQVRGGYSFLEFGRLNRRHPHEWCFVDQPVAFSRFFGPDGLRSTGVHVMWESPWGLEATAGLYNAHGETMFSFNQDETPVVDSVPERRQVRSARDMAWLGRLAQSFGIGEDVSATLGVSWLHGPNASGRSADTDLFGADLFVLWNPLGEARKDIFVELHAEALIRRFERAAFDDFAGAFFGHAWFQDWGWFAHVVVGFAEEWSVGLRWDQADGEIRARDPLHDARFRISPAVTWSPCAHAEIRLQYNYDHASHVRTGHGHDEHSVWLQVEVLVGGHDH